MHVLILVLIAALAVLLLAVGFGVIRYLVGSTLRGSRKPGYLNPATANSIISTSDRKKLSPRLPCFFADGGFPAFSGNGTRRFKK